MSSPAAPIESQAAMLPALPAAAALPGKQKAAGKRASTQKQPARAKKAKPDSTALPNDTIPPKDLVLAYMRQQNRPYNSQLIFDNLQRAIKKPALESLLEELVAEEFLIAKDLGKTRVFMYSQKHFEDSIARADDTAKEILELKEEVQKLEQSTKHKAAVAQRFEEARARVATLESLRSKVAKAEAELAAKQKDPEKDSQTVSAAAAAAAEHLHAKLHAAWATQKRRCHQLVQLLAERTQTDDKQLQEELGLERDEDFIPLTAYASY